MSERFSDALRYAEEKHRTQRRKGSDLPYSSHLLAVCSLVLEDGGSEDEAIAALLHDAPEDQGGEATLNEIRDRFGADVADIVEGCSDTFETPKPPWRRRKQAYIDHLQDAPPSVLRVSLADKLHNARSILGDQRQIGDRIFERFGGRKEGTLWYYSELARTFLKRRPGPMADELQRTVTKLRSAAGGPHRAVLSGSHLGPSTAPAGSPFQ